MLNLESVSRLYENVLLHDYVEKRISNSEIRAGIQSMGYVYAPNNTNFESTVIKFPNFNDPACRCAYLYKYAPLHTYIVQDAMLKILQNKPNLFRELVTNSKTFEFCSLGGGPGSDFIGVLAALQYAFGYFDWSITIIDCMERWEETFRSIIHELTVGVYGELSNNIAADCKWNYIGFNLLSTMTNEVNKSIAAASFITMVKFVSAVICTNTEEMVDKIFRVMKPGALVLFIDNAAGGFTQLIERSSRKNGLVPVFGPLRHVPYVAEALKIERFGYTSCFKTTVTIILLKKSLNPQQNRKYAHFTPNHLNQNVPSPKPLDSLNFVVMDRNASKISTENINNSTHSSSGHSSNMNNGLLPTPVYLNLNLQKPNSNSAVKHGGVGVTNNTYICPSNINILPTKVDNLKSNLQKPSPAAVGQKTGNVTTARSKSPRPSAHGSLNINPSQATRANLNHSLRKENSNASLDQKKSNVRSSSPPKRSERPAIYVSQPFPDSYAPRSTQPAATPRVAYRPVPSQETDNNSQEICCSCCTVS